MTGVDDTPDRAASETAPPANRWLVPAIVGSSLLMQTLSATVLVTALPTMAAALREDPVRLNLAISMYLLASAVFLPISGWASDKFGAKRVFLAAIALYGLSSAACGFAESLGQLVLARIFEGMAGAMMMPVGRLVLLRTTPKSELVGALSIATMPAMLGPMVGPVLGGFIVTFWDWRWIFFINLPISLAGLYLVARFVPDVAGEEVNRLDLPGVVLTGVGLASLIFGFENLGRDILSPVAVAALFGGGVLCLAGYGFYARRVPHPILDLSLFRIRTFSASLIGGAFSRLSMGALPFLLALLLQVGFGMSPFQAGLLTFMGGVGALAMKTTAPPILRRFGFRSVLLVNGVISGLLLTAYAFFRPDTPHWAIMALLLVSGFFRSLQFTSLNSLTFADIGPPQMSRASTVSSMGQQLTQSVGVGLAALMLHLVIQARGGAHVTAADIGPVFVAVGMASLISLAFFVRLPKNAGDDMNDRVDHR